MSTVPPTRHLVRAKDLTATRYAEPLTVGDLAQAARLSPAYFSREFRRAFGESPHQYLLTRRLERAAALLRTTDWSVADICVAVGLSSVGSFTTSFGRMFEVSPTTYRATYPAELGNFRWLTVGPAGQDDVSIALMAIPGAPVMNPETAQTVRDLMGKGFAGTVFLTTDDVYASYEQLKSRGVEFVEPPEPRPYGIDSMFRDPSGNNLRLLQPADAA